MNLSQYDEYTADYQARFIAIYTIAGAYYASILPISDDKSTLSSDTCIGTLYRRVL